MTEVEHAPKRDWLPRLVILIVIGMALEAAFSVPFLSLELLLGHGGLLPVAVGAAFALLFIAVARVRRAWWPALGTIVRNVVRPIPPRSWLWILAGIGVLARVAWMIAFPAPFRSDGSVYFTIAKQLSALGIYRDPRGEYAFWPPGYPFALLPFIKAFGAKEWVPLAANLFFFLGSLWVAYGLGLRCAGEWTAKMVTLIVTLWPNYLFSSGTASKELLLVLLVPLALLLYLRATDARGSWSGAGWLAGSGAAFALASLTQPGLLLLPLALVGFEMARGDAVRRAAPRLALVGAVACGLVGLWVVRNDAVLGSPVLSTNGGSTFYRANNPRATGGHTEEGERSLEGLGELERHRRGMEYGIDWIRSNPSDFLKLAWRKQVLFLGDDGDGVYETLKRGLDISGGRYLLFKLVSNLFWLGLWLLMLVGLVMERNRPAWPPAVLCLLGLAVIYCWLIDSVFESGARHHVPLLVILSALAALGWGSTDAR